MKTTPTSLIVRDVLETDAYDCSMGNAILALYPNAWVRYRFIDRGGTRYPKGFADLINDKIQDTRYIKSDPKIREFLATKWNFLYKEYFEFIKLFQFNPKLVKFWQDADGRLFGTIAGRWIDVILFEQVCLMIVTQTYNEIMGFYPDSNWLSQLDPAIETFYKESIFFSEFALRRRAYAFMHDEVNLYLYKYAGDFTKGGVYVGTSSPYHSAVHGLSPKGTVAHQWYQFHAAIYGVEHANLTANNAWRAVYGDNLGTALTDTFTSDYFWATLPGILGRLFKSYRQDSGNPFIWTDHAYRYFADKKIDPAEVTLMYTDSLDAAKAVEIARYAKNYGFQVAFGLGGFFTNNKMFFKSSPGYQPLKIVVKLEAVSLDEGQTWKTTAKLSDDEGKHSGDPQKVLEYLEVIHGK